MLGLAAFADEISPDLDVQIAECKRQGVTHVELRGVDGRNVLDFDKSMRAEIKQKLTDNGLGVIGIGSPIGKVKLSEPFGPHFERFKLAVELAEFFDAPFVRIFSYYGAFPNGRAKVLHRLQEKIDYVRSCRPVLLHENERHIYGELGASCLDLHQNLDSPKFRAAFDFANFVQAGEDPLDNWPLLKPYTVHIHIKDALLDSGKVVPAGEGNGHIAEILKDACANDYKGFLSFEPHLAIAGQSSGFSGPELFGVAVNALRKLARENAIPLAS
ncbi:MAG TPA: sugar phosphate isomerase/epimerase [Verrucomicrobiae bacterium]|nr:sugar phosphate isomerase/epimerase [Verrucomicrobiae bacterium]